MNLIKAIFYSPLSVVAIIVFITAIPSGLDIYSLIKTSLVIYIIGLASTVFLGMPTYLILNKLNIKNGIIYTLIGFVAPIFICWMPMFLGSKGYSFLFFVGIVSGFFGAFCAYTFWLFAVPSKLANSLKTKSDE